MRIALIVASFCFLASAQDVFRFTFDDIAALGEYGRFGKGVQLESPGDDGSKGCIARSADGIYAQIDFWLPEPVTIREGARMQFAHRVATEGKANYIGIFFYIVGGQKVGQGSVKTGSEWQVGETKIVGLGPTGFAKSRERLKVGDRIERIQLYGRLAEKAYQVTYIDDWVLTIPGEEPARLEPVASARRQREKATAEPPRPTADELFEYDFETGRRDDYPALLKASESGWGRGPRGDIVSPGFGSKQAWAVSGNTRYLNLAIDCDFILRRDLMLWFDSKVITKGIPLYVGIYLLRADGQKLLISSVPSNTEWEEGTSKRLHFFSCDQKSKVQERGICGERYTRIVLYSKLDKAAPQTLMVDNLRLVWNGGSPPRVAPRGLCFRTAAAKKIDGRLEDWPDLDTSVGLVIGEAEHCHQHQWYLGPQDLCALVYVTHDDDSAYLAFVVQDDVVRTTWERGNQIHQGDCVLAGFASTGRKAHSRVYMFSPGDFEGVPPAMHLSVGGPTSDAAFAVARREGGYVVEAQIPKAELGADWQEGREVGFEAMVYDSDERYASSARKGIFTWASTSNRYDARECGRLSIAGPFIGEVVGRIAEANPTTFLKNPVKEPNAVSVRAVARPADEAGLPVGRLLKRRDLPVLRKKIESGSAASAFEILQILCNLYLGNCGPEEWELNAIDTHQATMVEKYVTRLAFMHLLTGDPRYAELARMTVMRALDRATPSTVATAYDWLAHYLTDSEKARLAKAAPVRDALITCANCPEILAILEKETASQRERGGQSDPTRSRLKLTRFDHRAPSPIRSDLLGRHPRILLTPEQTDWIRAKAAAVPEHTWRPPPIRPRHPPPPRREGNSGGPAGWLPGICLAYWVTGQDIYLEQGKMIMRRLCEYRRWGGHNHLPADIDLDAGHMLMGIGIGYDLLYHGMMPSERTFIRRKLVRQARKMYRAHGHKSKYAYDQNHTYIDNGGLWVTAVALYDEVPEAKEWYDFGTRIIKKGMHCCNAGDGGFYEGVAYWAYGGGNLLRLLYLFENVTGENVFEHYDCFRKTKCFLAHTTLPDWRHVVNMWDAGDAPTYRRSFSNHWEAMLLAASKYRDAEAQGLAELFHRHGRLKPSTSAWPLLWWGPKVAAADPLDRWAPYRYFDDFDMVFIRSSWQTDAVHFALRCGPPLGRRVTEEVLLRNEMPEWTPGTGHVHPDINAFIIFSRGEHLAVDTGYTLRKRTRDHNTIAVDGGGQIGEGRAWPRYQPWDRYGRIGEFFAAPGCYYYVRGEAARAYQPELELTQFDRHVVFVDPDYFLVFDELASTKPHTYEWLCHSIDEPQASADRRFVIRRGGQVLIGHTLLPQRPTVTMEDAIVEPTPWRPEATHRGARICAGLPSRQKDAQFLTVLALHDEGSEQSRVELIRSETALGATIAGPDTRDVVLLAGQAAGVETDAAHCFVRTSEGGQPVRWAMHQGTRLAIDGRTLVTSDEPLTCAWCVIREKSGEPIRQVGHVEAARKTALTVFGPRPPVRIKGARGTLDGARKTTQLEVGPGRHEIRFEFR